MSNEHKLRNNAIAIVVFIPVAIILTFTFMSQVNMPDASETVHQGVLRDVQVIPDGGVGIFAGQKTIVYFQDGAVYTLSDVQQGLIIGQQYRIYQFNGMSNLRIERAN